MAPVRKFQHGDKVLTLEAMSFHSKSNIIEQYFDLSAFGLHPDTTQLNGSWGLTDASNRTKGWVTEHLLQRYTEEDLISVKGRVEPYSLKNASSSVRAQAKKKQAPKRFNQAKERIPHSFTDAMALLGLFLILLAMISIALFPFLMVGRVIEAGVSKLHHCYRLVAFVIGKRLTAALSKMSVPSTALGLVFYSWQNPFRSRNSAL